MTFTVTPKICGDFKKFRFGDALRKLQTEEETALLHVLILKNPSVHVKL